MAELKKNEYERELELINEKFRLEKEQEKERQATYREQAKVERIRKHKENSIKKYVAKVIASIILMFASVISLTFVVALFLPQNVEKAIQIIKSIVQ